MWTYIKLSKSQFYKLIQSGGFLGALLSSFGTISYYGISLCNRWCDSKEIPGRGVVRAGKGITLMKIWMILLES